MRDKNKIAVFLDRDGTINEEVNFVKSVKELKLIPNAAKAINRINNLGLKTIILSNQSGIARGFFSEKDLFEINNELKELLSAENATIDSIYYCPHHPEGIISEYAVSCTCRKPDIGLILQAGTKHNLEIQSSFMIGDMIRDLECGRNAGMKSILVLTGKGKDTLNQINEKGLYPDFIANDLLDAVEYIENNI